MPHLDKNLTKIPLPDANVWYAASFFTTETSDLYFKQLMEQVNWKQEKIKMFGKEILLPRLTAWYGDKSYTYSGLNNKPQPWLPVLLQIKEQVEAATGHKYNSVLLNHYQTGQNSMGWHSDDEPELGPEPNIASVSFGAERRFGFRHRHDKAQKNLYLLIKHGSLLLMQGPTQHNWQHAIPKTAQQTGSRINLTFRTIVG
ncbi:alpha-ketoglutarate-dependent dioxygenase AlkB [Pontibacter sp. KCTC 32443]|uniref:alpha-ketoglutarate-dependent dioxygenase AlkB family protein n=1 Tax=Pontibacter TaxID=323449 RepID=UPI00164D8460|nr:MULTISPECIES: alpha-ketoglutarate-dependent dioxygenase AlkB [Pontibacter]MBC5774441.1 alpha-ketoglutarate-dependent dioxygenase AlkB [Pontibacter sp. KCTC 32443]